jgi:hypothetical protein
MGLDKAMPLQHTFFGGQLPWERNSCLNFFDCSTGPRINPLGTEYGFLRRMPLISSPLLDEQSAQLEICSIMEVERPDDEPLDVERLEACEPSLCSLDKAPRHGILGCFRIP